MQTTHILFGNHKPNALVLLATIFILLFSTHNAYGDIPWQDQMTGGVEAPELQTQIAAAREYWRQQGIVGCPEISSYWADEIKNGTAVGLGAPCAIAIRRQFAVRIFDGTLVDSDWTPLELCTAVVHEVGHTFGLQHTDADRFPIMASPAPTLSACPTAPVVATPTTPKKGPAVQRKKSKRLYTIVLQFQHGVTRSIKVRAVTREIAEHRAMKFHPHAIGVKHDA